MVLQTPFSTVPPVNAVYDFTDIEDGTGIINYYALVGRDTASIDLLTNRIIKSELAGTGGTFGAAKVTIMEKTFKGGAFNTVRTIGGTAMMKLPVSIAPHVSNDRITVTTTLTFIKYDTSETTITTFSPLVQVSNAGASLGVDNLIIQFPIPNTLFQIGTSARIKIKVEMQRTAGTGTDCEGAVGHDPSGTSFSSVGTKTATVTDTQLITYLPFRIDQ